jgi:hypothetical protein
MPDKHIREFGVGHRRLSALLRYDQEAREHEDRSARREEDDHGDLGEEK